MTPQLASAGPSARARVPGLPRATTMDSRHRAVLLSILLVGLALRLYGLDLPMVDSLHQRQTFTAMASRNLYIDGVEGFLRPRYDIFGTNPGYAALEFPLYNGITAALYSIFGMSDALARAVSVGFSVGAAILTYMLARNFLQPAQALVALAIYQFSPLNIYMSRAVMPESLLMFLVVGSVFFCLRYLRAGGASRFTVAAVLGSLAFLVKPQTAPLIIVLFALWASRYRQEVVREKGFYLFSLLTVVPLLLWTIYAHRLNASLPTEWTLSAFLSRGNWWDLLEISFYVDLLKTTGVVLATPVGFLAAAAGVRLSWRNSKYLVFYLWIIAIAGTFALLPNVARNHPYYQLPLLPPVAILAGVAADPRIWLSTGPFQLLSKPSLAARSVLGAGVVLLVTSHGLLFATFFSDAYDVGSRVPYHLEVAQYIREGTPSGSVLILDDGLSSVPTTLTYYANRRSLPFKGESPDAAISELEKLRGEGGGYLVVVDSSYRPSLRLARENDAYWNHLVQRYRLERETDHWAVFELSAPPPAS